MGGITVTYKGDVLLKLNEGETGTASMDNVVLEVRKHEENNGTAAYTGTVDGFGSHNFIGVGKDQDLSRYADGLRIKHERG